jgi:hypothetical protein
MRIRRAAVGLAFVALLLGLASITLAQSQDSDDSDVNPDVDVTLQELEDEAEREAEQSISEKIDAKKVVLRRKSLSKNFKSQLAEEAELEAEDSISRQIDEKKVVLRKAIPRRLLRRIEQEAERQAEESVRGKRRPKTNPNGLELSASQLANIKAEADILAHAELIKQGVLKPEVDCELNPCYEGCPLANKEGMCIPLDCTTNHCRPGCPDASNRKKCPHIKHNATTALSVAEVTYIVNRHNEVRRMLGLNLVEWDIKLSEGAQRFADTCAFKHSKREDRESFYRATNPTHTDRPSVGETLIADASIVAGPRIFFDAVIGQAENFNCERNFCRDSEGRKAQCGAFRQAFDDDTTKVGCGFKVCLHDSPFDVISPSWNNFVCWYNPMIRKDERPFPRSQCNLLDLDTLLPNGPVQAPDKYLTLFAHGNKKVEKPPREYDPWEKILNDISAEYYEEFPQYKKFVDEVRV